MPASLYNPFPPVEILDTQQIEQIDNASLQVLEQIGIDFLDAEALSLWKGAGARVDFARQHVWIKRSLIRELIASAPPTFPWRARNPLHDLTIGGNAINFGPCGGMVFAHDLERGRRPGTLADLHDFYKLGQMCKWLHFGSWEQVAPSDVNINLRHLHRLYAALTLSDKPVMEAAHGRIITGDCIEMARIAFGGNLPDAPVIGDVINATSPLRYDQRMLGGLITLARHGQVAVITPFILAGAMSPITMASALAQQHAEALAGIALTQLVRPGAPVVYGGFTINTHMKSGAPSFGTPEGAWAAFASTQLARRYHLPYRGNGGLTMANGVDAQAAHESLWHLWPAVLAHSNMVMHSCGWLEGGLTASYEKFVLDGESLGEVERFLGMGGGREGAIGRAGDWSVATQEMGQKLVGLERAHQRYKALLKEYESPTMDISIREALLEFVTRRTRELQGKNLYEYEE
ncbi:MAG: trimethylamine methyltransferase family protein [Caldilineaceae bacterium]